MVLMLMMLIVFVVCFVKFMLVLIVVGFGVVFGFDVGFLMLGLVFV